MSSFICWYDAAICTGGMGTLLPSSSLGEYSAANDVAPAAGKGGGTAGRVATGGRQDSEDSEASAARDG